MLDGISLGIVWFLELIRFAVVLYLILSWFLSPSQGFMQFLGRVVDPMLRPFRNLLFRFFPRLFIDPSPLLFFLLMGLLIRLIPVLFSWISPPP